MEASGFVVNYLISLLFAGGISDLWYLHANVIGIIASISTNFILNKAWTFGDRDFSAKNEQCHNMENLHCLVL